MKTLTSVFRGVFGVLVKRAIALLAGWRREHPQPVVVELFFSMKGELREMGDVLVYRLKYSYRIRHRWVLDSVEGITEEQFAWKQTPTSHSIAWNFWHLGRWADYLQAKIPLMTPSLERKLGPAQQIWMHEGMAASWGLDSSVLGWGETGMEMDDKAVATMRLPGREVVGDYARRAFAAAERAVDAIDDDEFRVTYKSPVEWEGEIPICSYIVSYLAHNDFHRGQIAANRRAMDLPRVRA